MNTNAIHNVINIAILVLGAATGGLIATGCVETAPGILDCAQSWLSPSITGTAVMVLAGAKTVINVVRDGLLGLFKPQPPVV